MMGIKVSELEVFLDLLKTKSFSKTAENLSVSQANVSKIINKLEFKLGVKVFDRDSRPVKLTSFGRELLPFVEAHVLGVKKMSSFVEQFKKSPNGTVKIYAPTDIQVYLVKKIIPELKQKHPDINISFVTLNPEQRSYFTDRDFIDDCDIFISSIFPKDQNVVVKKLKEIDLNIYATEEFQKKHRVTHPSEFAVHPFILQGSIFNEEFYNQLDVIDNNTKEIIPVSVSGNIKLDNGFAAYEFCRKGLGYLVYSSLLVDEKDNLVTCLDDQYSLKIQLYAIYKQRASLPFRVKVALDFLIESIMGKAI